MSDEKALLAAIWDRPHDDLPRLAYADWLEETGDPAKVARAEFIRVQCELARTDVVDPQYDALREREAGLWTKHRGRWKAGLPATFRSERFVRGFLAPTRVVKSAQFLALGPADLAPAPLWGFEFKPNSRDLGRLLSSPNLPRVGRLALRYWLEKPGAVARFATSPGWSNLSYLSLPFNRLGDAGVDDLAARAESFPHLNSLDLTHNDVTVRGITALAESDLGGGLRLLPLDGTAVGDDGLSLLAESPAFPRLESTTFDHWGRADAPVFTPSGLAAFFGSPHRARLRHLRLGTLRLGPAAAGAIAATRPAFRLATFDLCCRECGDDGLEVIAEWPGLASVRELSVSGFAIGERGVTALARSPHLGRVTRLRLVGSLLTRDPRARSALSERFGPALEISRW